MGQVGFITDKLEIKLLILYIASRLVGPAPFEMLQDLSMCDEGVDYFGFSECLADLVRTEHLVVNDDNRYAITEKGRLNCAACETMLPYSVRMQVEKNIVTHNELIKRRNLVSAKIEQRDKCGYSVTLSLSDELDSLMKMELLITREDMAKELKRKFENNAEVLYSKILSLFYDDQSKDTPHEA